VNIYLKHPRHGTKIATMELEAEYDEQNGWVRYNPNTQPEVDAAPVNILEIKRRGRPPRKEHEAWQPPVNSSTQHSG
jgi:hypothetical protein